jgi:hypothetical protein
LTVDYTTENAGNSAIAGTDYVSGNGTITFGVNEMEKDITVQTLPVGGLKNGEHDEFFWLRLVTGNSTLANVLFTGVNPYSVIILD